MAPHSLYSVNSQRRPRPSLPRDLFVLRCSSCAYSVIESNPVFERRRRLRSEGAIEHCPACAATL